MTILIITFEKVDPPMIRPPQTFFSLNLSEHIRLDNSFVYDIDLGVQREWTVQVSLAIRAGYVPNQNLKQRIPKLIF